MHQPSFTRSYWIFEGIVTMNVSDFAEYDPMVFHDLYRTHVGIDGEATLLFERGHPGKPYMLEFSLELNPEVERIRKLFDELPDKHKRKSMEEEDDCIIFDY